MTKRTTKPPGVPQPFVRDISGRLQQLRAAPEFEEGLFESVFDPVKHGPYLSYVARQARALLSGFSAEAVVDILQMIMITAAKGIQSGVKSVQSITFMDERGENRPVRMEEGPGFEFIVIMCIAAKTGLHGGWLSIQFPSTEGAVVKQVLPEHALAAIALSLCQSARDDQRSEPHKAVDSGMCAAYVLNEAEMLSGTSVAADVSAEYVKLLRVQKDNRRASNSRWARLEPVKALAFVRRAEMPSLSRSAAIDKMLPEIVAAAEKGGVRLFGVNVKATVERWFREAAIK